MIQPTHVLGLPAHLRLDQIEITPQTLILSLAVETALAVCPLCQQLSHHVHSHYTRTLADLPCGGKALRLLVLVRRFFCEIEGEHNAVGLFHELTARGYTGSRMTIERFLLGLRRMEQQSIEVSQATTSVELTPRRAVGLMLRRALDLTDEERTALQQVS